MKKGPFKMKGMDFGISPIKQDPKKTYDAISKAREIARDFVKDPRIKRKTTSTLFKHGIKRFGPVGAAITAYEVGKTIPKVVKATQEGLKKRARSGNVNIGRKL